ncbi:antiviral reverse transcriptase Drt3b [Arsukibacterium indicum]|uniref:RNA-directed DNA polymerase n=1 Tax=Arsukibacterium indicum TaxID=2848612 RepID=A0ABS6MJZ3_9GAMM|nr:antiviral reverse transcriptase Drt3b [Arsukibacterium indicum]MBV2129141.1 RNA-directed DNA polymerase [Arsukibacterium indicum]
MSLVKVNKNDIHRVILTEVLPYETPMTFLNEGLYFYLLNKPKKEYVKSFIDSFFYYQSYTQPYNYRINKNSSSKRLLSLVHPAIQVKICSLYNDYDQLITELCSRSKVSLRAPTKVASRFYEKELVSYSKPEKSESVEVETDAFEKTSAYASSYFTYSRYNFLYKFYDSYESHRLEKKFETLIKFDISKCFHNIYVPSLSWSVKTKEFSKKHSSTFSFEKLFQDIMINANDDEASGIVVGPEFSRIYAEIILQRIDLEIIERAKNTLDLEFDYHYSLKRYVDDYFLFVKEASISSKLIDLIKETLESFKLFINDAKTEVHSVPFITGLTIAKMDCSDLVNTVFSQLIDNNNKDETKDINSVLKIRNPGRESNKFIKELKRIVKENNVRYESLSGYTLSKFRHKLQKFLEDNLVKESIDCGNTEKIESLILFAIETSFFIYSMDIRVRTTYIITQIVVLLNSVTENAGMSFKDTVRKKIFDESVLLIQKMEDKKKECSIELLNLLISLKTNLLDYPMKEERVLSLFNIKKENDSYIFKDKNIDIGYFQLMVCSYIYENKDLKLASFIENLISERLSTVDDFRSDTELTCLFFDSMRNPFFSETFKKSLFDRVMNLDFFSANREMYSENAEEIVGYLSHKDWFFTWDHTNLAQILIKKELRSPY